MRIGIITLPLHTNYGGILQAYALQTVLQNLGHEVVVISKEKYWQRPAYVLPFCYAKRVLKNILGYKCEIFGEYRQNKEYAIIGKYTIPFIEKYINRRLINNFKELKEDEFDAIVVGSDQVWRPDYFGRYQIENAFLSFAKEWDIKRVAYAASFGKDIWEYTSKQTKLCKRLVSKFNAVSVREDSGVALCKKYFGKEAKHVVDPTLLLNVDNYIQLFNVSKSAKSGGNLLCYILDENTQTELCIKKISSLFNLKPFKVNAKVQNYKIHVSQRIQPPVETWLRGFYDAEFVVTDSFHACVFSILFRKQFVVYGNKSRGFSRFTSLLKMFNLENRLITEHTNFESLEEINYEEVYRRLNLYRDDAFNFLKKELS